MTNVHLEFACGKQICGGPFTVEQVKDMNSLLNIAIVACLFIFDEEFQICSREWG